jgi:hypothetical protein
MNKENAYELLKSVKGIWEVMPPSSDDFTTIRYVADELGESFVFDFFDKDNDYTLFYFYLAQSGISLAKEPLTKMLNDPSFCEKDNPENPYWGSLGLLILNDSSGADFLERMLLREVEELYYFTNEELLSDLLPFKNDAIKRFAMKVLKKHGETFNDKELSLLKMLTN